MKIRLTIGGQAFGATLQDSAASRDFLSLLPLSLSLQDYASTEKIADLPRKLSTEGAPAGTAAAAGDLAYYAPWGNLAIFYKPHGHASGLLKLGSMDAGAAPFDVRGPVDVTIEAVD